MVLFSCTLLVCTWFSCVVLVCYLSVVRGSLAVGCTWLTFSYFIFGIIMNIKRRRVLYFHGLGSLHQRSYFELHLYFPRYFCMGTYFRVRSDLFIPTRSLRQARTVPVMHYIIHCCTCDSAGHMCTVQWFSLGQPHALDNDQAVAYRAFRHVFIFPPRCSDRLPSVAHSGHGMPH